MSEKETKCKSDKILKRGSLKCPCHNEPLWFKNHAGMRIVSDAHYSAKCSIDQSKYFLVIADKQN